MTDLFVSAFVTFFVVIDPPGCAPIFASLTQGATAAHRRAMALKSVLIAAAILIFFAVLGEDLLKKLGVSLHAFKIAGGIMLFLIALEMVFEKRQERRSNRAEEVRKDEEVEDNLPDGDGAAGPGREPEVACGEGGAGGNGEADRGGVVDDDGGEERLGGEGKVAGAAGHADEGVPAEAEEGEAEEGTPGVTEPSVAYDVTQHQHKDEEGEDQEQAVAPVRADPVAEGALGADLHRYPSRKRPSRTPARAPGPRSTLSP